MFLNFIICNYFPLCSYLYVIVIPLTKNKNGEAVPLTISPNDIKTVDLEIRSRSRRSTHQRNRRATSQESEAYIAAKLMGDQMPESFAVGDGSEVNGYRNKPLKEGEYYTVFTRAVIQSENGVSAWRPLIETLLSLLLSSLFCFCIHVIGISNLLFS